MQRTFTTAFRSLTRSVAVPRAQFSSPVTFNSTAFTSSRAFSAGVTKIVDTPLEETKQEQEQKQKEYETEEQEEELKGWRKASVIFGDLAVGTVLGVTIYFAADYLLDFPEPCQLVFEYCKHSPFLEEHVGFPLTRSLLWYGSVKDDYYRVEIGVSGPKGNAVVHSMGILGSNKGQPEWQIVRCDAAMEKFAYRLTDLMPADPRDNVAPYVPSPDDPTAQLPPGVQQSPFTPVTTPAKSQ